MAIYFGFDRVRRPGLPLVAVPTTQGSGAEVSSHAVIVQVSPRKKEVVAGLHLLPIPRERVQAAYLPAELTATSYPNLIDPGTSVPTLAVGAVMAAYNWPAEHPRNTKVRRFVDHLFADFDRLKRAPYHPKWQQVDLSEPLPGWQRLAAARAKLGTP